MIVSAFVVIVVSATPFSAHPKGSFTVVESGASPTHIVAVAPSGEAELGTYPSFGGNVPFAFDLSHRCELVVLGTTMVEESLAYQVVEVKFSAPGEAASRRVLFSSDRVLNSPRWSPRGDAVAFVELVGLVGTIKIVNAKTLVLTASVPGHQFIWRADNSLLVYRQEPSKKPACHEFVSYTGSKSLLLSRFCEGMNGWLPASGAVGLDVPSVVILDSRRTQDANVQEVSVGALIGNKLVTRATLRLASSVTFGTVACEKGVSYLSDPITSLVRDGDSWRFVPSDVCNASGALSSRPTSRTELGKSQTCTFPQ